MIEDWLAAEPQLTALAIVGRLSERHPHQFGKKQHSIVQRLLKALRKKAAEKPLRRHGYRPIARACGRLGLYGARPAHRPSRRARWRSISQTTADRHPRVTFSGEAIRGVNFPRRAPLTPVAVGQPDDAGAGAEALLRMSALAQDDGDERRGVAPDLARLPPDPFRRPVGIAPVTGGHVLGVRSVPAVGRGAHVRSDPLATVEHIHRARRDASPHREAPSTATNSWACRTSLVAPSNTSMVAPA